MAKLWLFLNFFLIFFVFFCEQLGASRWQTLEADVVRKIRQRKSKRVQGLVYVCCV